jgi:hypothetical protein
MAKYLISSAHFRMSRVPNLFPELWNDHRMDTSAYLELSAETESETVSLDESSTLPRLSDDGE